MLAHVMATGVETSWHAEQMSLLPQGCTELGWQPRALDHGFAGAEQQPHTEMLVRGSAGSSLAPEWPMMASCSAPAWGAKKTAVCFARPLATVAVGLLHCCTMMCPEQPALPCTQVTCHDCATLVVPDFLVLQHWRAVKPCIFGGLQAEVVCGCVQWMRFAHFTGSLVNRTCSSPAQDGDSAG